MEGPSGAGGSFVTPLEVAVVAPRTLVLRRGRDGVRMEGKVAPDPHTLSARFVQREIESGLVSVRVTLNVEGGPLVYELTGFEPFEDAVDGDGRPKLNFTAWQCRLVEGPSKGSKEAGRG